MPDATFWIGEDLGELADALAGGERRSENPLAPLTVVVPNPLVGQWLEQSLARRATGRFDGVAANLDVILPAAFIGRAVYDDPSDLDAWSADGFALGMLGARLVPGEFSVNEAWRRAERLADVLYWRPEQFDDYLETDGNERERELVRRVRARGVASPWTALDATLERVDHVFAGRVVLVDCAELTTGDLLARVVARVAKRVRVDGYFVAPTIYGADGLGEDVAATSLAARWSTSTIAHLDRWRANCPTARWVTVESRGGVTAMRSEVVTRLAAAPTSEADAHRVTELLVVHGAVGYARQVEIARDALLSAIRETGAAPHEVRVVTTDAERFVALMNEYWTRHDDPSAPTLQFEVADPAVAHASARLRGFSMLLTIIASHGTIYDVVALLSEPAIQEGIGLTRHDVERVLELALAGGVSLGFDGRSRESVAAFTRGDDAGTWGRLRDRGVLASVFDIDDPAADLAIWPVGIPADLAVMTAVSRLLNALVEASEATRVARTMAGWKGVFAEWAQLVASSPGVLDVGLDRVLDRLSALVRASEGVFTFDEARELFERVATSVGGSSVIGRGGVSVLSPYALSRAPYRVTCVLGLDDELLPSTSSSGSHLGEPRAGDPSPRDRFRAALLSLVATTSDRVVLLTNGREVSDGSSLAPALVLAELTEALMTPDRDGVGLRVPWRDHPRFAFSTVPADGGAVYAADLADDDGSGPFSLDPTTAAVATLLHNKAAPSLEDDLAVTAATMPVVAPPSVVELQRLIRFVKDPQGSFLATVFGGAAVAEQRAELPDVPRLDLDDGLAQWRVRHSIVRRALDTGEFVVPGGHLDDPVAAVATGFRERVRRAIDVAALSSFVEHHRADMAMIGAARAAWSERPAQVAGLDVALVRPAIEVYDTRVGPILVEWTVSSKFVTALVNALVTAAAATVERGAAVAAVIVRPDYGAQPYVANPYVTLAWRGVDPVRSATTLLDELVALYREQFVSLPLHFYRTSLAGSGRDDLDAIYSKSPETAWGGGFTTARADRTSEANQLLLPFSFDEIAQLSDGAFGVASRRVRGLFDDVAVTSGSPTDPTWPVALSDGGVG